MEREIIQEGMRIYLKLAGDGVETVGDRMFYYQQISGFLPMEVAWVNGQKQYVYDISGKITLEKYCSERSFGLADMKHIFSQIIELPEKLDQYLLDGNGAVIQEEYLYIDMWTKEISAVFFPGSPFQGIPAIGGLLEFIMDKMKQEDKQLSSFIYGMHRLVKQAGTTRQQIRSYIQEYDRQNDQWKETEYEAETSACLPEREDVVRKIPEKREVTDHSNKLPTAYLLPVVLLTVGLLIPVILWYCGCFTQPVSGETDWTMGVGAFIFFSGVTGYGAWKLWPKQRASIIWEKDRTDRQKVCLIPCQGQEGPLPISHFPFLLGNEEKRVDGVITADGVSGIHARILQEGEQIIVMDEESQSGTFYNDQKLAPWQKKRVQDGDLLRFGQGEYVVEITT